MSECIFCKIINKEIPATIIQEDNDIIVVKDIAPKAPIHFLIIPKKHSKDITFLQDGEDVILAAKLIFTAKNLAKNLGGNGEFRLVANTGKSVGQSIFHTHFHFLSGKTLQDL